jgi:hypothetical protein
MSRGKRRDPKYQNSSVRMDSPPDRGHKRTAHADKLTSPRDAAGVVTKEARGPIQAIPFESTACGSVRDARHIFSIEKISKAAKSCSNYTDLSLMRDSISIPSRLLLSKCESGCDARTITSHPQ